VASESVVLTNMGIDDYKMVEPGEMVIAGPEGFRVERYWPEQKKAHCFFEWVYFSNLATSLEGRSVYKVRHAIGRELARMENLPDRDDHLVLAVPETANTVAQSYAFHLGLPVIDGLLRNRYVGRTFIDGVNRGENVRLKYTPLREVIQERKVFLVDDTLVRGTTLGTVIEDLRERGRVKEVHVRIGNPPIMGPCFYGIDIPTIKELFAPAHMNGMRNGEIPPDRLERMAAEIGADSLTYLSMKGLFKAVGLPKSDLCLACLNSDYPTPVGRERYQEALAVAAR
ncbi:MAG: amidophosphoribosyltransferase, partial [bacterium]